jgi:hypothetical protein
MSDGPFVVPLDETGLADIGDGFFARDLLSQPGTKVRLYKAKGPIRGHLHAHDHLELIYVVSGSFTDRGRTIPPGSFVARQPGEMHEFHCEDDVTLLLVDIGGPA